MSPEGPAGTEKRLQTEVVKPAEAERDTRIAQAEVEKREGELRAAATAERVKIEAGANAEQTRVTAEAQATATGRTGQAEALATRARGDVMGAGVAGITLFRNLLGKNGKSSPEKQSATPGSPAA